MRKKIYFFVVCLLSFSPLYGDFFTSLSVSGKSDFGISGDISDQSMVKIKQSSNTDWSTIITNNGGAGKGLLIRAGSGATAALDVRDWAGNSRFLINSNGSAYFGVNGDISEQSVLKIRQSSNTDWSTIITNNGGSGKGLLIRAGSGATAALDVRDWAGNSRLLVNADGAVYVVNKAGIADSPHASYALNIGSPGLRVNAQSGSQGFYVFRNDTLSFNRIIFDSSTQYSDWGTLPIAFTQGGVSRLKIDAAGNILVGCNSAVILDSLTAKLSVNGMIAATEIKVRPSDQFPDYVFDETYVLKPLPQLKTYLKTNKHLPGIPSAREVEKKGLSVGDMQLKLLQKAEELTLYTIQLNEKIETQQKRIEQLEKETATLKTKRK